MSDSSICTQEDGTGFFRILGVEDNHANQRLLEAILRPKGHNLTLAENGVEALEILRTGEFDVILMDMQMPVMDGLAATRAIRVTELAKGFGRMPIAILTAHAMDDHIAMAGEAGADFHISKPVTPGDLMAGIKETVTRARNTEKQTQSLTG